MNYQTNSTRFHVYRNYVYSINKKIVDEDEFIKSIKTNQGNLPKLDISIPSIVTFKKESFYYDPLLEAEGLFTELMKLPTIWDNEYKISLLTTFIQRYGLPLGEGFSDERFEWRGIELMNFHEFNRELFQYQEAFKIWVDIKQNKVIEIKKYVKEYSTKYMFRHKWGNMPLNDKEKAFYVLAVLLSKKSKGNFTFILSNGKPHKIYTFNNLFEVAYLQLSNFIEKEGKFRSCKNCGYLFHETHGSRVFCHTLPPNNISACANTYKQKVQRDKTKAKKLGKEGKEVREILEDINSRRDIYSKRTMSDILKWTK